MKPQIHTLTGKITTIEHSPSWDVVLFYVKAEWERKKNLFQAGQFMVLQKEIEGKSIKRSYSIFSTPNQFIETWEIWFSIKRVHEWVFSSRATQSANIWDEISMKWSLWHMIDRWDHTHYLFVSVWSGLSPIYALSQDIVLEKNKAIRVANLFWERHHQHVLSSVEDTWVNTPENVYSELFLSQEDLEWYTTWRVQAGIPKALEFLGTKKIRCFLCGRPDMVTEVREILIKSGVDSEDILFEKY